MFRRNYIVKPMLQLKYLLYGLGLVLVSGLCVYFIMDLAIVHSERLSQLSQGEILSVQAAARVALLWALILLLLIVTVGTILIFHRLIGPVYAVEKVLRMVADGDLTVYMPLRKGDELREMAEAVEQMVGGIRRRLLHDKENALACQTKLRQIAEGNPSLKAELNDIAAKLDRVGQEFRLG
ncbi:MAG TPA: HAMP domain-containing protein [Elusimicrobiota bacterium]|nr:HAMP domain-containing protein [Elusimicrobiota bacterium]